MNIDNQSLGLVDVNLSGVRLNPQAAAGGPDTRTLLSTGNTATRGIESDEEIAGMSTTIDFNRAMPKISAPWFLVEKLARGDDDYLPNVQSTSPALKRYRKEYCRYNDIHTQTSAV